MDRTTHVSRTGLLPGLLVLMAVAPSPGVQAVRNRGPEVCSGGRSLGDKWFDGCQWCVCTVRGALCSRSGCSSLVRQVAPCHVVGLRWTDGCYRCRCKRNGIACRLDVTCLLLRHRPVPCLADERCVCGLDGVPSCTAEVIDRNAYSAKRVDLILPPFLDPEAMERYDHSQRVRGGSGTQHRRRGPRASWSGPRHQRQPGRRSDAPGERVSQELLITSDNLCSLGPRWYGGSLRCYCDMDGAITCGNPAFVTAFYDDFVVARKECEEGHLWEDGCSICSCRRNGVVFCRHDRQCRHRYDSDDEGEDDDHDTIAADDNDRELEIVDPDRYWPGNNNNDLDDLDLLAVEGGDVADLGQEGRGDLLPRTPPGGEGCEPRTRWNEPCARCHCNHAGRPACVRRRSRRCNHSDNNNNVVAGADGGDYDYDDIDIEDPFHRQRHQLHRGDEEGEGREEGENGYPGRRKPRVDGARQRVDEGTNGLHNAAHERPATFKPLFHREARGPFMNVPPPATVFRGPPAYSRPSAYRPSPCGRFKVGAKFWKACNLCMCTTKGPRCQGKLCW